MKSGDFYSEIEIPCFIFDDYLEVSRLVRKYGWDTRLDGNLFEFCCLVYRRFDTLDDMIYHTDLLNIILHDSKLKGDKLHGRGKYNFNTPAISCSVEDIDEPFAV